MLLILQKFANMVNRFYLFDDSKCESNSVEAKKYALSSTAKLPALTEFIKFISDGCCGLRPQISEETIDDAFDCLLDGDKATIYSRKLTKEEREYKLHLSEVSRKLQKETIKSWLKVKE